MTLSEFPLSTVVAIVSGGVGVKLLERFFFMTDSRKKQNIDLESQYLDENSRLRQELFKKVDKLEVQIDAWRDRYGVLYNESQDQKDAYRSLKRDYEELKEMHQELKVMHQDLTQIHEKREQDYIELHKQHENILKTCDELRQEVKRFEKQVTKDVSEVREEVKAATS